MHGNHQTYFRLRKKKPTRGMRSICFNPKTPRSSPSNSPSRFSISTPRRTESLMEQTIDSATALILKWNPDSSTFARVTSLFYENRREATQFLKCVYDLQKIMHLLVSQDSADDRLIHSQNLMQIAMKRLQKEFYQILSMNRAHLDPESVSKRSSRASTRSSTSDFEDDGSPDDEARLAITEVEEASTVAMSDLKSIAECMIYSGYTKECLSIYKSIRKSIIDEGIYRLGVEKLSSSQVNKMDWHTIEIKIRSWLEALRVSIRTLFNGERILCDHVFASSDSIGEACFTEISKDGAMLLFGFPELVAKTKKLPEKMFRILDMYTAISENWPEIDSTFSFESTSGVKAKALDSLVKLIDCVRILLSDFETSVQKDSSKTPVPEGGLHSLTFNTMDYLTLLADYSNVLSDIIADLPPLEKTPLPESYFNSPDSADSSAPAISVRFAWLILVLLCKLDGKSKHYKDVSLSYLFLANNLQHVVSKVRTSNLKYILGEDWITKHVVKVKQFVSNYERLAWGQVLTSLPDDPSATLTPQQVKEKFRKFTSNFEEAYKKQSSCVISNPELRDEMKNSISRKLLTKYRQFYDIHKIAVGSRNNERMIVRYAPEDVEAYLSDLYFDTIRSDGSFCSWSSSSSSHKRRSRLSG